MECYDCYDIVLILQARLDTCRFTYACFSNCMNKILEFIKFQNAIGFPVCTEQFIVYIAVPCQSYGNWKYACV